MTEAWARTIEVDRASACVVASSTVRRLASPTIDSRLGPLAGASPKGNELDPSAVGVERPTLLAGVESPPPPPPPPPMNALFFVIIVSICSCNLRILSSRGGPGWARAIAGMPSTSIGIECGGVSAEKRSVDHCGSGIIFVLA